MPYPNKEGAIFNFDFYLHRHIPWARKLSPDQGTEIRKGISSPTAGPVPYVCICQFWISSEDEYRKALEKHGKELMADLSNFTNIEPVLQIDFKSARMQEAPVDGAHRLLEALRYTACESLRRASDRRHPR
jgi:uncharacterized protein (TIGR02118 family)